MLPTSRSSAASPSSPLCPSLSPSPSPSPSPSCSSAPAKAEAVPQSGDCSLPPARSGPDLVKVLITSGALRFGEFNTKSGRRTPYFINTAMLYYSHTWQTVMTSYVKCAHNHYGAALRCVYGHAYKGIPLCASFAMLWHQLTGHSIPFAFNRKETKSHGEQGSLLTPLASAAAPTGVVICDDVLTSGKSLHEAMAVLSSQQIHNVLGAVVLMDRQEQASTGASLSAKQAFEQQYQIPVLSLVKLDDIMATLAAEPDPEHHLAAIQAYQRHYGVSTK